MPSFEKSVHKTYGVLAPWFSMYSGSSSWFVAELVVENILVKASFVDIIKSKQVKSLASFFQHPSESLYKRYMWQWVSGQKLCPDKGENGCTVEKYMNASQW